ncbi:site-specific integrase [Acidipila sp. EB88]|uniref:tyrosine-type recombinase/integrase n=1 Tax=Acidipila sp. EB88 TaxID=2305226 RepID=UPI000F60443A|nr:site-specific integrase [Acidipila sp. EB88]RRA49008.1 site-specific integrase [Acidipila sp. EB88]
MRTAVKAPRGVYEHPAGTGIWHIHYYDAQGKRHREKIGKKSDAIRIYQSRKADAAVGRKMPELRRSARVTISDLIDLALAATASHKDAQGYINRSAIVREELGAEVAEEMTPQKLDTWLNGLQMRVRGKDKARKEARKVSNGTQNKYRAFLSLCYREGLANGKVTSNPARLTRQRKPSTGRERFLSREEYNRLLQVIQELHPDHAPEFIISVHTGMRLSEQFSVTWGQVDLERKTVRLTDTKNGSNRTVRLDSDAIAAFKALQVQGQKGTEKVWGYDTTYYRPRKWFVSCLKEAKITGYTWHCNRHTFCSWLAMVGASISDIMALAGHKTTAMAARYSHLSPEHTLSVVERLSLPR